MKNRKKGGDIYCGLNMSTGKCYIGQTTKTLKERIKRHKEEMNQGSTSRFHNSIRNHGIENFLFWVIHKDIPKNDLDFMEKYYIRLYNTEMPCGYNMTPGGDFNPSYVPEIVAKRSGENHWMNRDPEALDRHRKRMEDPEVRAKVSGDNHWTKTNPEAFERFLKTVRDPELQARRSASISGKNHWSKDPEKLAKAIEKRNKTRSENKRRKNV